MNGYQTKINQKAYIRPEGRDPMTSQKNWPTLVSLLVHSTIKWRKTPYWASRKQIMEERGTTDFAWSTPITRKAMSMGHPEFCVCDFSVNVVTSSLYPFLKAFSLGSLLSSFCSYSKIRVSFTLHAQRVNPIENKRAWSEMLKRVPCFLMKVK